MYFITVLNVVLRFLMTPSLPRFLYASSRFLTISLSQGRRRAFCVIVINTDELYERRTNHQMKNTRTEISETVPDASTQLSSPHFDELAVAFAQPVQPLAPRTRRRLLRSSLLVIAYLAFIVAVVGIAYLRPPGSRADTLSEAPNNETQLDVQPAVNDSSAAMTEHESIATLGIRRAQPQSRRGATRIRIQNQTIQMVEAGEGKPVPRKVGEIRYGRSSDRP
jgi:hypothetical protein